MTRRGFLLAGACLVATAGPSLALSFEDDVAARLLREGYRITYRKRTWLGRVRFKAQKGKTVREVVVDPTSGEVLRDYSERASSRDEKSAKSKGSGGGAGSGGSAGGETGGGETGGEESGSGGAGSGESGSGESGSGESSKESNKESSKGKSKGKPDKGNADG